MQSYNGSPNQAFFDSLNVLKSLALTLTNNEKMTIGVPIAVAIGSSKYWRDSANYWNNNFNNKQNSSGLASALITPQVAEEKPPMQVNYTDLGMADSAGGIDGAIGGLGGALAGGVLGAAVGSSYEICSQMISYYTGWW